MSKYSKNTIILKISIIIALIVIYLLYIFLNTISINEKGISKDIEKRVNSTVEIIEITENRNEKFVLFLNKNNDELGVIYYEPYSFLKIRYSFLGGIFDTKKNNSKYGVYDFGAGLKKGYDRLVIVFVDNRSFNGDKLEVNFKENKIIENIANKDYFMKVFRFWKKEFISPEILIKDKNNKDITIKFL